VWVGGQTRPVFFSVDCWESRFTNIIAHLHKGSAVNVDGVLYQDTFTNNSGKEVSILKVFPHSVGFPVTNSPNSTPTPNEDDQLSEEDDEPLIRKKNNPKSEDIDAFHNSSTSPKPPTDVLSINSDYIPGTPENEIPPSQNTARPKRTRSNRN
jgi:single-stranded DNA-binding protein